MVFIIYMYIIYIYIPRHMLVGGAITILKNDCSFVNGVGMTFFSFPDAARESLLGTCEMKPGLWLLCTLKSP